MWTIFLYLRQSRYWSQSKRLRQVNIRVFWFRSQNLNLFHINFQIDDKSSDAAFAIYYGKFQASAPKAKLITSVIEERLDRNTEYEQLLAELHQSYLSQRANVWSTIIYFLTYISLQLLLSDYVFGSGTIDKGFDVVLQTGSLCIGSISLRFYRSCVARRTSIILSVF